MTPSTTDGEERANSLDDKLREIITDRFGFSETIGDGADDVIAQIKQAFADDAKQKLIDGSIHGVGVYEAEHHESEDYNRMTGQEFYQRFARIMNEYDRTELDTKAGPVDFMPIPIVIEAAKRAAGITNET